MFAHSRRFLTVGAALALCLAACGQDAEKPAPNAGASAEEASAAAAPAAPAADVASASDPKGLLAATRAFATGDCGAVRRKLEYCAACEAPGQQPHRDLLLAYCQERDGAAEARALYEALITNHPNTEASATAIMRVRQIDAAELPPLSDYAGARPTPIQRHQPAYPTLAQQAGVEGKVRLRFDVRADGGVSNVRVIDATPALLFDSVALYAVSSWEYEKGQAAEAQRITLRFDLTDEEVAAGRLASGEPAPAASDEAAK